MHGVSKSGYKRWTKGGWAVSVTEGALFHEVLCQEPIPVRVRLEHVGSYDQDACS